MREELAEMQKEQALIEQMHATNQVAEALAKADEAKKSIQGEYEVVKAERDEQAGLIQTLETDLAERDSSIQHYR